MRSPIGPALVVVGLATTVALVLLVFQAQGLRTELERARADVAALQARVEAQDEGVTPEQLRSELEQLEGGIRDWLIATGADGGVGGGAGGGDPETPAGGSADEILERLDEVLDRIRALDRRVDEICEGVPVC
jgi:hypothetical protein